MFCVTTGLYFFEGWSNLRFHFIEQSSAEGITKEGIVKMFDIPPESIIAVAALRNEAVVKYYQPENEDIVLGEFFVALSSFSLK